MTESNMKVAEKYKYLFQGSHFRFEGLNTEIEEAFVKLVKEMGGEVSNDAPFTFVQKPYFEKRENNRKENFYNIDYIMDCVKADASLEMTDYMFIPDQLSNYDCQLSNDPMCYAARYIYKTDSCHKCYYENIFCKECIESNKESPNATNHGKSHLISASDSSSESEEERTNRPIQKVDKHTSKSPKRFISSESDQHSNDVEQINTSCTISPVRKKLKNSSDVDNTYCREESPEIDVQNDSSRNNSDSVNNSYEEQVEEPIDGNFRKKHSEIKKKMVHSRKRDVGDQEEINYSSDNFSMDKTNNEVNKNKKSVNSRKENVGDLEKNDDLSDNESNTEINKNKKLPQIVTRSSRLHNEWINSSKSKIPPAKKELPEVPDLESTSDLSITTDDEDEKYFQEEIWWVPHDVPEKERCTVVHCTYEPGFHRTHFPPRKFLSMVEKKIIVKYLVMKNAIKYAKGKKIYESMRDDQYLTHRSSETLRNCFRRTIIREIGNYKLDPIYVAEFKALRVKFRTGKIKKEKE